MLDVAAGNGDATLAAARRFASVTSTDYHGPVHKAFAALEADGQAALETDLIALLRRADRGGPAGLVVPAEYVETVIAK